MGNISAKGKIVIGETGKIKGEITCKNTDVSGFIDGKIVVAELLSLKATAKVVGDMVTSRLAIEPGSKFTGYCDMSAESEKKNPTPTTSTGNNKQQ